MQAKQKPKSNLLLHHSLLLSSTSLNGCFFVFATLSLFQNRNRESESESESRVSFLSSPQNLPSLEFLGAMYARKSLSLSANLQITTHYVTLIFFSLCFFLFFFNFFGFSIHVLSSLPFLLSGFTINKPKAV